MARGKKTGGRKKGSKNKAAAAKAAEIAASGLTPLDYLLSVLRDEAAEPHARMDAAKGAAPYVHPRLASIEHAGPNGGPIPFQNVDDLSDADIEKRIAAIAAEFGLAPRAAARARSADGGAEAPAGTDQAASALSR